MVRLVVNGGDILFHKKDGMLYVRKQMVDNLIDRGINSPNLINSLLQIPRHLFVSEALRYRAYLDDSLPIGFGQTISKPIIIASMVQSLELTGSERVLEIGTGSGYQTAILSTLASAVVSTERIKDISRRAMDVLLSLKMKNFNLVHTDDFRELPGTFDRIVVAAGASIMPDDLLAKLNSSGILIIPIEKEGIHNIIKFKKYPNGKITEEIIGKATFVPYIEGESA